VIYSVDFAEIKRLQHEGRWQETAAYLTDAARKVEQSRADFIVLCTNTMHRMADAITEAVSIPLLNIADATAEEVKARDIRKVGLLWPRNFPRIRLRETIRKVIRATLRAWIWPVYEERNGRKSSFLAILSPTPQAIKARRRVRAGLP
jgi:hypothetical protein